MDETADQVSRDRAPVSMPGARVNRVLLTTSLAFLAALVVVSIAADRAGDLTVLPIPISFLLLGWLVLRHEPTNAEGRLLMGVGLAWAIVLSLPFVGGWVIPVGLMGTHLLLRFPDGNLPSPRWRWFARICTASIAVCTVVVTIGSTTNEDGTANPFFVPGSESLSVLLLALPIVMLGSAASLIIRYRRSADEVRAQLRWLALAGSVVVLLYIVTLATSFGYDAVVSANSNEGSWFSETTPWWLTTLQALSLGSFILIPVAFGIAILRYRLYDIDRLISRTASYAIVSALVIGTYAVVVTVVTSLLPDSSSSLAVAAATLAAAALARPLLKRVRQVVDRRFDRTHYNRLTTASSFGEHLRHLVDSEDVADELLRTVDRTLQPTSVGMLIGPAKATPKVVTT